MNFIEKYERENNKIEEKKIFEICEKAKEYKSELQTLVDLNFENPNEDLKNFAKKNKMDLKDPKIKKYFLDIRKKYLEEINQFYDKNFFNFKNFTIVDGKIQGKIIPKKIPKKIIQNDIKNIKDDCKTCINKNPKEIKEKLNSKNSNWNQIYDFFSIPLNVINLVIIIILIAMIIIFFNNRQ